MDTPKLGRVIVQGRGRGVIGNFRRRIFNININNNNSNGKN